MRVTRNNSEFLIKGKGDVEAYEAPVLRGRVLFEVDGVDEPTAREAIRKGSAKLPIKTRFVIRNK
jgi:large subunit ribosomal protein L16